MRFCIGIKSSAYKFTSSLGTSFTKKKNLRNLDITNLEVTRDFKEDPSFSNPFS